MKSLDIDSISTNSREYGSQRVIIEYTGGIHRQRLQQGTAYKVTVPYGSFSQKLQTIHRFGGKIISVSIPYLQLDSPQVVSEVNLEQVSEPILAIAIEQFVEVIPNNPLEINVENVFDESSEVICEISPEPISQIIPETFLEPIPENVEIVSAVETPVASPKKKKSVSETTTKPKKPKTSTKSSQGFSKQEAIFQPKASVSEVSEPILETVVVVITEPVAKLVAKPVVEIIAEPITETIVDEITEVVAESIISSEISSKTDSELTVEQAIEAIAKSSLPETKSKKSKTTSKSGSGFNKPKDDTKTSRPPRKPKH